MNNYMDTDNIFKCISLSLYGSDINNTLLKNYLIDYIKKNNDIIDNNILKNNLNTYDYYKSEDLYIIKLFSWLLKNPIDISIRNKYNHEYDHKKYGSWFKETTPIKLILKDNKYYL